MKDSYSIKTVDINPDGSLTVAVCCKSSPLDPENYPQLGTWNPYSKTWDNSRSDPFESINRETHSLTPKKISATPKTEKLTFASFLKSLK